MAKAAKTAQKKDLKASADAKKLDQSNQGGTQSKVWRLYFQRVHCAQRQGERLPG